jgi:hypothetical protein
MATNQKLRCLRRRWGMMVVDSDEGSVEDGEAFFPNRCLPIEEKKTSL